MNRVITPGQVLDAVESVMLRPWDWLRDFHCLGDAADVFRVLWHRDPMQGLRGQARTFGGARRIVAGAGGMARLAEREFAAAGLVRSAAAPGVIGLAPTAASSFGPVAVAICVQPGLWAGKSKAGYDVIDWDGEGWSCPS